MKRTVWAVSVLTFLAASRWVCPQADVNLPLGGGASGIEGLRLVTVNGVNAQLQRTGNTMKVTFNKTSEERRFLALEAVPKGNLSGAKALVLRYRVNLSAGQPPRLAMMVFEKGGGVWFKVNAQPVVVGQFAASRVSVTRLRLAEFSEDENGQVDWDRIEKIRVGFVADGKAQGSFDISEVRLTSAPYKASQPLTVTGDGAGVWSVAKDPAVQASLTTPHEGPDGQPCMKFAFTFPGQRHMYALPTTTMPDAELDGYRGLRFTYKATLPAGINGLLVMLVERDGSQYYADPAPPASGDWRTVTIPFEAFALGGWSKDENGRLDLDQVASIVIGVHGTASGAEGRGIIWATDVTVAP